MIINTNLFLAHGGNSLFTGPVDLAVFAYDRLGFRLPGWLLSTTVQRLGRAVFDDVKLGCQSLRGEPREQSS